MVRPTPPPPPPAVHVARPAHANGVNGGSSAARAKPTPPAPPAKRPAAGRKPAPPRDSGTSLGNDGNSTDSGRNTPTPSLAGGLAEALRARQSAMQKGRDEEEDW